MFCWELVLCLVVEAGARANIPTQVLVARKQITAKVTNATKAPVQATTRASSCCLAIGFSKAEVFDT